MVAASRCNWERNSVRALSVTSSRWSNGTWLMLLVLFNGVVSLLQAGEGSVRGDKEVKRGLVGT